MKIRLALVAAMIAAASPCLAAAPPTCPLPNMPEMSFKNPPAIGALKAMRSEIISKAADFDAYDACLARSMSLLEDRWKTAGSPPDPVVRAIVHHDILVGVHLREMTIAWFNQAVARRNSELDDDSPDAVSQIAPGEISPSSADYSATPSAGINAPSYANMAGRDCGKFYPPESLRDNESGFVVLGYDVGADGALSNIRVLQSVGFKRLENAALACAQHWRNTPALLDGVPVVDPGRTSTVRFDMN